jgi:hypothetical protein
MEGVLLGLMRAAWRGDHKARRRILEVLRDAGLHSLAAVIRPAFGPEERNLDAWLLAQIGGAVGMSETDLDEVMPWRSARVAAEFIGRALHSATGVPWQVVVLAGRNPCLVLRSPAQRLTAQGEMPLEERQLLARLLEVPVAQVGPHGLTISPKERRRIVCLAQGCSGGPS